MQEYSSKPCKTCGVEKSLDEYRCDKYRKDGHMAACKSCMGTGPRKLGTYYVNNSGVCRTCGRGRPDVEFGIDRAAKLGLSTICKECKSDDGQRSRALHREKISARSSARVRENRYLALTRYGGLPPLCACCGEGHFEFLAIDHINGGGRAHLRSIGRSAGNGFCNWLRLHGFPDGFQVLCHNCNLASKEGKPCPHVDPSWERDVSGLSRRDLYAHHHRTARRHEILKHYGGSPPACACCGESHHRFLAIDHVEGGGYRHMKRENHLPLDYLISRDGFPEGYRILCHNCNMAKGFYGRCPH